MGLEASPQRLQEELHNFTCGLNFSVPQVAIWL